ncbi:hypothetical protein [Nocardia transvalensis]|uniref:hypothetical protein n=1 Tax=Nocardia transvalensis TaxID=37333 RepID=UPI001893BF6A|nr:hypothetical protein [Nocardia transvalensis]MBF6330723.1 hypothetical protein [Nocardia transvalensis]
MKLSTFAAVVVACAALTGAAATAHARPDPTASVDKAELTDSGLEVTVSYTCESGEIDTLSVVASQTAEGAMTLGGDQADAVCDGTDQTKKFTITPAVGDQFESGEIEVVFELIGPKAAIFEETVEV